MDKNELRPGERLVEGKTGTEENHVTAVRRNEQLIATDLSEPLDERVVGGLSSARSRTELEQMTLHEERARVEVLREQVGSVSVRKVVRQREEVIPVTLTTEVLEITVKDGAGKVTLNGEALEPGRTYEVLVHDERAVVQKEVFAHSDVTLSKEARTYTHTEQVTLRREELDVNDPQGLAHEIRHD